MAFQIATKCSQNLTATSSKAWSSRASAIAMLSISEQYIAIQAVPSACSRATPAGSGMDRSKTPMLSSPRKPPEKSWVPATSLRFAHQVKLRPSLMKIRFRKSKSGGCPAHSRESKRRRHAQAWTGGFTSPKLILVGRQLAVRVHVPLPQHQDHLLASEVGIQNRERDGVESQIPGGEPGELPLVRHRDDVAAEDVPPVGVAAVEPLLGWREDGVAVEPVLHHVVVELLGPDEPCAGLAQASTRPREGPVPA